MTSICFKKTCVASVLPYQLVLWTILQARWPQLASFLERHPQMVERVGQQNPPDVDEDLQALFDVKDVVAVVKGGSVDSNLQEEAIKMCARIHA